MITRTATFSTRCISSVTVLGAHPLCMVGLGIIRPHRYAKHKIRPIAINVAWSVCVSVCLSVGHEGESYKNG